MDTGSALSVFAHSIMGSSPVVPACSEVNISMWNFTVPGEGPYKIRVIGSFLIDS